MIKKKKLYARPKKLYQTQRIKDENELVKIYGLKNKREIWKTLAKVNYFRSRAKNLAKQSEEDQNVFLGKLKSIGLNVGSLADVLSLRVEDLLDRRLPTVISKKKIANTVKHARQLVVHKKILVDGRIINAPSYLVPVEFESSIVIKNKKRTMQAVKAENAEAEA